MISEYCHLIFSSFGSFRNTSNSTSSPHKSPQDSIHDLLPPWMLTINFCLLFPFNYPCTDLPPAPWLLSAATADGEGTCKNNLRKLSIKWITFIYVLVDPLRLQKNCGSRCDFFSLLGCEATSQGSEISSSDSPNVSSKVLPVLTCAALQLSNSAIAERIPNLQHGLCWSGHF